MCVFSIETFTNNDIIGVNNCTTMLLKPNRVVVGTRDPNPVVDLKGVEDLRSYRRSVTVGVEQKMCDKLNEAYIHRKLSGKPFLTLRCSVTITINLKIGSSTSSGSNNSRPAPFAAAYHSCLSRTGRINLNNNGATKLHAMTTARRRRSLNTKKNAIGSEAAASYIPIYVMLPLGFIDKTCQLVDEEGLEQKLKILKLVNVDGVIVECFWGIIESHSPKNYEWGTYMNLFELVKCLKLKLQVLMSFHGCSGNMDDEVSIPLPQWVLEAGQTNPDIFFTDIEGRRNRECLSWGVDNEPVLAGRTAVEVYFDYMKSFREKISKFFEDGTISGIEVGLGPCGELRYPSHLEKHGWRYPGIGQFQCHDKYLLSSLSRAAVACGKSGWARVPQEAGSYNSSPHETGFFCNNGDYDSYYGRFFLSWYSRVLLDHGDRVLSVAKLVFAGIPIAAKLSGVYWCNRTISHAAELTAGFYNPDHRNGYTAIIAMLKKHGVTLNFTCVEMHTTEHRVNFPQALANPEALVCQVLNEAWDAGLRVAAENALPCYTRDGYDRILENARPTDAPDERQLCAFTYHRLNPVLMERHNIKEFKRFVVALNDMKTSNPAGAGTSIP